MVTRIDFASTFSPCESCPEPAAVMMVLGFVNKTGQLEPLISEQLEQVNAAVVDFPNHAPNMNPNELQAALIKRDAATEAARILVDSETRIDSRRQELAQALANVSCLTSCREKEAQCPVLGIVGPAVSDLLADADQIIQVVRGSINPQTPTA